jgi:hypothetical protein
LIWINVVAHMCRYPPDMCFRGIGKVCAVWAALMVAACETQVPRPNFLVRSLQDCENGDASACAMLESLQNDKAKAEESNLGPDPRTQVEKNADAIMEGIRRGRQPLPSHVVRIAPTTGRDL